MRQDHDELALERYEERAAILEYCANMPRAEAEKAAAHAHLKPPDPKIRQSALFADIAQGDKRR